MPESVYKIIELVGSSPNSWEEAAKNGVEKASQTLKDLRIAEVTKLYLVLVTVLVELVTLAPVDGSAYSDGW